MKTLSLANEAFFQQDMNTHARPKNGTGAAHGRRP